MDDRDDEGHRLEAIDPHLEALLGPARAVEPVAEARRDALRARLEHSVGSLETPSAEHCAAPSGPSSRGPALTWWVAAAAILTLWVVAGRPSELTGAVTARGHRVEVHTGDRGTVVAESGADLSWSVEDGVATVEHSRGRAFYRVEPDAGRSYTVRTPAGEVRVTGTSFEVEVVMPSRKQNIKHMSLGAAIAAVTVVTVYEGRVVLANDAGATTLMAGERASAEAGRAPSPARSRFEEETVSSPVAGAPTELPPQSVMVSNLRARVRELEHDLAGARESSAGHEEATEQSQAEFIRSVYAPSPEELTEAAERCALSFAVPSQGERAAYLTPDDAADLGISEDERAAVTDALDEEDAGWNDRLRDLYIDATGDEDGASSLSEDAIRAELLDKLSDEERREARQRVARERAGLLDPTTDETSPPAVRYYRAQIERTQRALGATVKVLGDEERAYEALGHMPSEMSQYDGCK